MQSTSSMELSGRKKKSTTVRACLALAALRWTFKCLDRLAPRTAARLAAFLMFCVPNVHTLYTHGLGHRRLLKDGDVIHQVGEFLIPEGQTT